jgi:hypothetical protein
VTSAPLPNQTLKLPKHGGHFEPRHGSEVRAKMGSWALVKLCSLTLHVMRSAGDSVGGLIATVLMNVHEFACFADVVGAVNVAVWKANVANNA